MSHKVISPTTQQNTITHKNIIDFKCEQCYRIFESSQGLKIHIGSAYKSQLPPENLRLQDEDTSIILIPPKYVKEYTPVSEELNEKTEETNIIEENKYEIIRL